jgi:hypothetical protein
MEVGGEDIGRITFELRADAAPKTAENFVSYCCPNIYFSFRVQLFVLALTYIGIYALLVSVLCAPVRRDLDTRVPVSTGTLRFVTFIFETSGL